MENLNVVMKLVKEPKLYMVLDDFGMVHIVSAFTEEEAITKLKKTVICFHPKEIKECESGVCYGYDGDVFEYKINKGKKSW